MAKSQKYQSKRRQASPKRSFVPLLLTLGGAILLIFTLILVFRPTTNPVPAEVTGTARLKVDKQEINLGNVKLGTPVKTSFQLTNIGDQTLRFTKAPYIEIIEGC